MHCVQIGWPDRVDRIGQMVWLSLAPEDTDIFPNRYHIYVPLYLFSWHDNRKFCFKLNACLEFSVFDILFASSAV
jgi:hypothetical protein